MKNRYDYSQIPPSWRYCFNSSCPMSSECLRYQTGQHLPDDHEWGQAVFPPSLKEGRCRFFRKDERVSLATGFVTGNRRQDDMFIAQRRHLTRYLGGQGTYFLYRNGQRWLSPEQQEYISRLLREAGYPDEVRYAQYKEDYYYL